MEGVNKTGKKKSTFQLNLCTNGFCFLCLKPTNLPDHSNTRIKMEAMEGRDVTGRRDWSEELSSTPPTSPLLKHLCRHLKINIGKIATEVIRTPAIIEKMGLTSIEKADMKVTLCGLCSSITEKFSSLFVELERIKMETDHCLTRIQNRMTAAEEDTELFTTYQESMAGDIHSLLLSGFIDELKKEITRKCGQTSTLQESSKIDPDGSSSSSNTTAKTPPITSTNEGAPPSAQATTRMPPTPGNGVPLNDDHAELINISDSEDEEGDEIPDNDKPADEGSNRQEVSAPPITESNATANQENIIIFPLHSPPLPESSKRSRISLRPASPSVVVLPLNQEQEDSSNAAELVVDIGDSCEENDDKENEEVNDLINIGLATSASTSKSSVLPVIKTQKSYKCKLCEKTFPRLIDVRVHKKKAHTAPAMPISIITSPPPPQLSPQNQNTESSNEGSDPGTLQPEDPSTVTLSLNPSSPAEAILGAEKEAKFSRRKIQSSGNSSDTGIMEMVQGAMSNQEARHGMNGEKFQQNYAPDNIQVAPPSQQQFKVPPQPKRLKRFSEGSQLIGNHFLLGGENNYDLAPPKQKRSKRISEGSIINRNGKYVLDEATGKYKCVEATCTSQFTSKTAVHRHNQSMHLMIRYTCDSCGRDDFRYTFLLTKHQNKCTGRESGKKLENSSMGVKHNTMGLPKNESTPDSHQ